MKKIIIAIAAFAACTAVFMGISFIQCGGRIGDVNEPEVLRTTDPSLSPEERDRILDMESHVGLLLSMIDTLEKEKNKLAQKRNPSEEDLRSIQGYELAISETEKELASLPTYEELDEMLYGYLTQSQ